MSAENAIRYLLANNAPVLALVTAPRIQVGELQLNTLLPAITVEEVDSVPLNFIDVNTTPRMHTDRVQVTVHCKPRSAESGTGRDGVKALLRLVLAACPSQRGVNGIAVESIVPDIKVINPYNVGDEIHSGSRDFIVKWNE